MDDFTICPICGNKLRTLHNVSIFVGKEKQLTSERTCTKGMNHSLMIHTNPDTGKVVKIKISLSANYSKFIEVDYILNKSTIMCIKDSNINPIILNKILDIDFNELEKLRKKVDMLIAFS